MTNGPEAKNSDAKVSKSGTDAAPIAGDERIDFDASIEKLQRAVLEIHSYLNDNDAASAFILSVANTGLVRKSLDLLIGKACVSEQSSAPKQSTLFSVLALEADCESLESLLLETMRAHAVAAERMAAIPYAHAALLASQGILEQLGGLLCSVEMQEPGELLPSGSHPILGDLSAASRINRAIGGGAELVSKAVEAQMQLLKVA